MASGMEERSSGSPQTLLKKFRTSDCLLKISSEQKEVVAGLPKKRRCEENSQKEMEIFREEINGAIAKRIAIEFSDSRRFRAPTSNHLPVIACPTPPPCPLARAFPRTASREIPSLVAAQSEGSDVKKGGESLEKSSEPEAATSSVDTEDIQRQEGKFTQQDGDRSNMTSPMTTVSSPISLSNPKLTVFSVDNLSKSRAKVEAELCALPPPKVRIVRQTEISQPHPRPPTTFSFSSMGSRGEVRIDPKESPLSPTVVGFRLCSEIQNNLKLVQEVREMDFFCETLLIVVISN